MDNTTIPPFEAVPFASGATTGKRNAVPVTTSTPGAASYTAGFPPETFQPIASGGIPPSGADFNGVLYDLSKAMRWEQAGGQYPFNATFATAIGGYPKGAIVLRSDSRGQWLSTADNNSTDPDSGTAAGWIALRANTGTATIAAVAGANVPTPTQLGAQVLLVTGVLASNATLTLPLTAGAQWTVVNNTTGAGTLTVQGASGTGVQVTQATGIFAYTDGTNYYAISASVSGAYLPINGTAVAATKLATARAFNLTGPVTWAAQSFDGTADVTLTSAIAANALNIGMTSGLQTALDAKAALTGATFTGPVSAKIVTADNVSTASSANPSFVIKGGGYGQAIVFLPNITSGSFNPLANSGDAALIYGNAANSSQPLTIAPWASASGGIRLDGAGSITGGLGFTGLGSANTDLSKGIALYQNTMGFGITGSRINYVVMSGANHCFVVGGSDVVTIGAGGIVSTGGFQSSDRRLKTNIAPRAVQRGIAMKLARMFCEWDRIADGVHDVGLVAQRVKALASRYVLVGKDKRKLLAIDKAGIALEASMDCALQLDEQAKTIKALLRRIAKLEKQA